MKKLVIAVDFDGTIVENKYPEIGTLLPHALFYLHKMRIDGHRLILWTCRTGDSLKEAVDFCNNLGVWFDEVNENLPEAIEEYGQNRKIFTDLYIDDKAVGCPMFGGEVDWEAIYYWVQRAC